MDKFKIPKDKIIRHEGEEYLYVADIAKIMDKEYINTYQILKRKEIVEKVMKSAVVKVSALNNIWDIEKKKESLKAIMDMLSELNSEQIKAFVPAVKNYKMQLKMKKIKNYNKQ